MDLRFCRECMIASGLDPTWSKVALSPAINARNRFVFCDGPLHGHCITVDSSGQHVAETPTKYTTQDLDVRPGHSLSVTAR